LSSSAATATIAVLNILTNHLSIALPNCNDPIPYSGIPHMSFALWLVNVQVLQPSAGMPWRSCLQRNLEVIKSKLS
jgi:hypothetical protein